MNKKLTNSVIIYIQPHHLFLGYQQVNDFCSRKLKIVELGRQQEESHRHCKQHKYFNLFLSKYKYRIKLFVMYRALSYDFLCMSRIIDKYTNCAFFCSST